MCVCVCVCVCVCERERERERELLALVPKSLFVVQALSHAQLFVTPWSAAHQASLSFAISWSLFKLMSIELVMPSNSLIVRCPLLLFSIFPSIRISSSESALGSRGQSIGASVSACLFNEYSKLISFRIDWFDLLAVQGTLKSLL